MTMLPGATLFARPAADVEKAQAPDEAPSTTELKIYSAINEDETKALAELFTRKTGVKVAYIRAATGELVNRVIAEKGNPQADLLLGGAESLHISAAEAGALHPYAAAVDIPGNTSDPAGAWTGFCVLTLGIGVNEERFKEKFPGQAYPATWDDLANPAFKDELIFTDPTASSTGYLFLQSQLQRLGSDAGWAYFKKLVPLAAQLPSSGGAPPRLVGTGEYSIGVAYVHALQTYTLQGFPVKIIVPPDTAGEIDAVSILQGCANLKNAERFIDFMLEPDAQALFVSLSNAIPVNPAVPPPKGGVSLADIKMMNYDSVKAGAERDATLAQWRTLF